MKVLITGATGLIGTEIVSLFHRNNIDVNYLSTSKKKLSDAANYKGFYWDPKHNVIDEKALDNVDGIIHLAGATIAKRWTKQYKSEIVESRTNSANLLFETLKREPNHVRFLISSSAIGIYADSLTAIHDEQSTALNSGFLGDVVREWEASVDQFQSLGIRVCKFRIGMVLSGNGGALPELVRPIKYGLGAKYGNGKQICSWIHLEDLAQLFLFAIINSPEGTYNAVAPNPVTNSALINNIAKTLNKPIILPLIPRFVFKAILGEMHELLFSSQNVSSNKIQNAGFRFKFTTIDNALDEILSQ